MVRRQLRLGAQVEQSEVEEEQEEKKKVEGAPEED